MKTIDIDAGTRFGRWTVVGPSVTKGQGKNWECRCDCGTIRPVLSVRLRSGKSLSCGCLNIERSVAAKWKGAGELSHTLWTTIVAGAALRNFQIDLSIEQAWALFEEQQRRCALTGVALTMYQYVDLPTDPSKGGTTGRRVNGTASLDRIDSSRGYVEGNVQWVHKYVNAMKLDHNQDEFIRWCALVVQHSVSRDNNLIATQSESYSVQPSISPG